MRPSAIAISTFMQPALSSWPYAEMQNFAPLCCGVASLVANFVNVMSQKSKAKASFLCPTTVCHQFSLLLFSLGIFQLLRSEICQRNFVREILSDFQKNLLGTYSSFRKCKFVPFSTLFIIQFF